MYTGVHSDIYSTGKTCAHQKSKWMGNIKTKINSYSVLTCMRRGFINLNESVLL